MPLKKLLTNVSFDSDTCAILVDAFEGAWNELVTAGDPIASAVKMDDTRLLLAKQIIELGHQGERDLDRLRDSAIARLRAAGRRR